jgi:hypothetical protein
MNSHPPRLAWALLTWLSAPDDPLVGDLAEEYRGGKTRRWYWRQALSLLVLSPSRRMRTHPLRALRGVAVGWAAFLAVFAAFDASIAPRLSTIGYSTGQWSVFWTAAFICSYVGFAISAWIVSRTHRDDAGPVLLVHVASVLVAMAIAVAILEIRARPTPVPHVLFPLVSVALPYQWRSGFLLAPLTMMMVGLLSVRNARRRESR